jgi:hypothetical protein
MAALTKQEIIGALTRLGQLAEARSETIELVLVGGALMVLAYEARQSTRDVDVVIPEPGEARTVRAMAGVVASERGWPEDWLNDAVKGYLVGLSEGPVIFSAPGIEARRPALEQLLAMKLSAWRDDVDIADARRLLQEMTPAQSREEVWQAVLPYLAPGNELKAQYAFLDLWEAVYGEN